jgi:hypothetical protein
VRASSDKSARAESQGTDAAVSRSYADLPYRSAVIIKRWSCVANTEKKKKRQKKAKKQESLPGIAGERFSKEEGAALHRITE